MDLRKESSHSPRSGFLFWCPDTTLHSPEERASQRCHFGKRVSAQRPPNAGRSPCFSAGPSGSLTRMTCPPGGAAAGPSPPVPSSWVGPSGHSIVSRAPGQQKDWLLPGRVPSGNCQVSWTVKAPHKRKWAQQTEGRMGKKVRSKLFMKTISEQGWAF